jgi:hypothetical protein
MQQATNTHPPRSVTIAIQLIWLTLAANALLMAVDYDDASLDAMTFNSILLVFNGFVVIKIADSRNWARIAYSVLVALDVALIFAVGLDGATDLDVLVTYMSLALEAWALFKLFGADADQWFRQTRQP